MKNKLFALLLVFVLVPFVFSDVGPSPSYSFEIDNLDEYSEYDFYAVGNIFTNLVEEGQNSVYKLNTHMKIVAVEKGVELSRTPTASDESKILSSSEIFSLQSGESTFSIKGIDTQSKTLSVELTNNTPDFLPFMLVDLVVPAIIGIVVLALLVVGAILINSKKKKNEPSAK